MTANNTTPRGSRATLALWVDTDQSKVVRVARLVASGYSVASAVRAVKLSSQLNQGAS